MGSENSPQLAARKKQGPEIYNRKELDSISAMILQVRTHLDLTWRVPGRGLAELPELR